MKIAIPQMLIQLREQLHHEPEERNRLADLAYSMWAATMRRPLLYRLSTWLATRTIGRWQKSGWLKRLPGQLHGWTASRDFPAPAPQRFRDLWNEELKNEKSQ